MWYFLPLSFFTSLIFLLIFWKVGGFGKYVEDHNKPIKRRVLVGGGLVVVLVTSIFYIFLFQEYGITPIALASCMLIALAIGLYDDLKGIKKWRKVPILLIASVPIPLMYLIYGDLWTPTLLHINFTQFYWLFIIPVVVAGFSNGGNVIAGYDGMEVGVYTLISTLYLVIGFMSNQALIIYLSGILLSSLLAMLIFNWYPSKLLLGNVGSFAISGVLGIIPLVGHFSVVLPIVFAPHLTEVFLQIKYTRKYKYDVFGTVDEKGVIHNKYGIKSVLHWIISWGNMTEKKITIAMLSIEFLLCLVAFFVWYLMPL